MFWKRKKKEEPCGSNKTKSQPTGVGFREEQGKFHLFCNGKDISGAEFDKVENYAERYYLGYKGKHPYMVDMQTGNVYDLFQMQETDMVKATERVMNWVLPGLQMFYRDTDEPIDVERCFKVGDTLRAGIFVDVSPYAGKPMHKYRYIIASAHAAKLCEYGENHPLYTLHPNSYLKVMDVYEKDGVTQIFLLHIPAKAVFFSCIGSILEINIGDKSLVEVARESLCTKLSLPVRENLEEEVWLDRTRMHIGYASNGEPFSLFPLLPLQMNDEVKELSKIVRTLGCDTDPINLIWEEPEK